MSMRYAPDLTDDLTSHGRIAKLVGSDKLVLDVGCGGGFVAERLVTQGCRVTGVDSDAVLLQRAETVCEEVICHDLEAIDTLTLGRTFDVVVMADILEHLRGPETLLAKAQTWLRPGGCLVISMPNVAHISVRIKLLIGRFDYASAGIMDRTHTRFYTHRSFASLLEMEGYKISEFVPVGRFPILAKFEHNRWLRRLETAAATGWPNGFALQFVVRAEHS